MYLNRRFIQLSKNISRHLHTTTCRLNNVKYYYQFWKNKFAENGISEPEDSIKNILVHAMGSKQLHDVQRNFSLDLSQWQIQKIEAMCEKRLKSVPIQYIIGEWQFRDLTLKMRQPVFIPRPETEMLVSLILENHSPNIEAQILELCCGSGAICISLLKTLPKAHVTAVDKNPVACKLTEENASFHGVDNRMRILEYELGEKNNLKTLNNKFDLIVSNPPYVLEEDMNRLQPEIKLYEDLSALNGGEDGLEIIRPILILASEKLLPLGKLYLEVDPSHPDKIKEFVEKNAEMQLKYFQTFKDFCNKDRFVLVEKLG